MSKNLLKDNIERISKEEIINYWIIQNHTYVECIEHFGLQTRTQFWKLVKYYNLHKMDLADKDQDAKKRGAKSSQTQKRYWQDASAEDHLKISERNKKSHNTPEAKQHLSETALKWQSELDEDTRAKYEKHKADGTRKSWKENHDLILAKRDASHREGRIHRKGQLCRSHQEQLIYDRLVELYPDVQYDVKVDDRYPHLIDFYIPSEDLFIEYQGYPSHGIIPFDETNIRSLEIAASMAGKGKWLEVYTLLDPGKLKLAQDNNLNYLRIYPKASLQENFQFNNNYKTNIITLIYNLING